jgi:uncharacterized protein YukE
MTTYEVSPDPVPAATGALTTAEITAILGRLAPTALQDAGAAHTQLGRELATMAAHLAQEAGTLAQNWSGVAARAALAQLQRLHQQTATLATQASRTGAVLTWLGTQVLPALNRPATPAQARQFLTHLTTALIQADRSLPAITPSKGTTSPGVASSHPVPTPPGRSGLSTTRRPASITNPAGLADISHSSPLSLESITSHSGQGSPVGTPLTSGPTHPAAPISSLQSAPVPTSAATAPATAGPAPAAAPGPTPTPGPIALAPVPPAPGSTTAAASSESATATPATSEATSDATPTTADVAPGAFTTSGAPVASTTATMAARGHTTHPRDPGDDHQTQAPSAAASPGLPATPAPATVPSSHATTSALPGFPGAPAGAPVPEVTTSGSALNARPLPELPTLDSGLSGGALVASPPPAITPTATSAPAPALHSFLPPPAGVPTPPTQPRHRESWTADDPSPWALPADCVPPLIEGP